MTHLGVWAGGISDGVSGRLGDVITCDMLRLARWSPLLNEPNRSRSMIGAGAPRGRVAIPDRLAMTEVGWPADDNESYDRLGRPQSSDDDWWQR